MEKIVNLVLWAAASGRDLPLADEEEGLWSGHPAFRAAAALDELARLLGAQGHGLLPEDLAERAWWDPSRLARAIIRAVEHGERVAQQADTAEEPIGPRADFDPGLTQAGWWRIAVGEACRALRDGSAFGQ